VKENGKDFRHLPLANYGGRLPIVSFMMLGELIIRYLSKKYKKAVC